jgi:hypothetical protein
MEESLHRLGLLLRMIKELMDIRNCALVVTTILFDQTTFIPPSVLLGLDRPHPYTSHGETSC